MIELDRKTIVTLELLSDGQKHSKEPEGLTYAQFIAAVKYLYKNNKMAIGIFYEGGSMGDAWITNEGMALYDDIQDKKKSIIRQVLAKRDLTRDQYTLMQEAEKQGKVGNIFGIDFDEFKDIKSLCV